MSFNHSSVSKSVSGEDAALNLGLKLENFQQQLASYHIITITNCLKVNSNCLYIEAVCICMTSN